MMKNQKCSQEIPYLQWNLVNMNSRGPSKNVHFIRDFTLTVASCISFIVSGDFKVVCIKQYFTLTMFVLTRFHCSPQFILLRFWSWQVSLYTLLKHLNLSM